MLVALAAALIVVGLVAGLVLALGGNGTAPLPAASAPATTAGEPSAPVPSPTTSAPVTAPEFAFRVLKFGPVRGSRRTGAKAVREGTRRAVHSIREDLDRMYRLAFLDPAD